MLFRIGFREIEFNSGIFLAFFSLFLRSITCSRGWHHFHIRMAHSILWNCVMCAHPAPCLCRVIKIPHSKMSFRSVHRGMKCKFNQFTFVNCCRRLCTATARDCGTALCLYECNWMCVMCAYMRHALRNCVRECLIKIKNLCSTRSLVVLPRLQRPGHHASQAKRVKRNWMQRKSTAINIVIYGSKQFHFIDRRRRLGLAHEN